MIERHFTVTVYILQDRKTLLLYHHKHHKWLPPGGHLELYETPPECAHREVLEETGLEITLIPQENLWLNSWSATSLERPYLCLLENIPPHNSSPAHQHIDLIYLAKPKDGSHIDPSVETLRWFSLEEVERLEVDVEIFSDVKQTIRHLLK